MRQIVMSLPLLLMGFCENTSVTTRSVAAIPQLDWPSIVFEDTAVFKLTTAFGNKMPDQFFVLDTTDAWPGKRFKLDENLQDPAVRKRLERDEHHAYNHTYIFRNEEMNKLVLPEEKNYLHDNAKQQQRKPIPENKTSYHLINSYQAAPDGFFFSVTSPVFSTDKQMAYIDVTIYQKTMETTSLNDCYFGRILLIYQYVEKKGWTKFKQMNHLFL